jgi:hypothetical protein
MAIHAKKQIPLLLFVGRRSLLPNGATPRFDPAEHVLPIIQRLLRYAQYAYNKRTMHAMHTHTSKAKQNVETENHFKHSAQTYRNI